MTIEKHLHEIFNAERSRREAEIRLLDEPSAEVAKILTQAVQQAMKEKNEDEAALRLTALARLCAQIEGSEMADTLLQILNHDNPEVRAYAGESLLEVAYDRYAEFARAIDRFLDKKIQGPALLELPFIIAEVGEPSALILFKRFIDTGDADTIASVIEACVELGDPAAIQYIKPFINDHRLVSTGDDDSEALEAELGELAQEAIEALEGISEMIKE